MKQNPTLNDVIITPDQFREEQNQEVMVRRDFFANSAKIALGIGFTAAMMGREAEAEARLSRLQQIESWLEDWKVKTKSKEGWQEYIEKWIKMVGREVAKLRNSYHAEIWESGDYENVYPEIDGFGKNGVIGEKSGSILKISKPEKDLSSNTLMRYKSGDRSIPMPYWFATIQNDRFICEDNPPGIFYSKQLGKDPQVAADYMKDYIEKY